GIVVAICGNILISVALNVQKYAHIRLAREKERQRLLQRKSKLDRKRKYGARNTTTVGGVLGSGDVPTISEVSEGDISNSNGVDPNRFGTVRSSNGSTHQNNARPSSQMSQHSILTFKDAFLNEEGHAPAYLRSRWWWLGIVLMTLGECGNFLAYGFAP